MKQGSAFVCKFSFCHIQNLRVQSLPWPLPTAPSGLPERSPLQDCDCEGKFNWPNRSRVAAFGVARLRTQLLIHCLYEWLTRCFLSHLHAQSLRSCQRNASECFARTIPVQSFSKISGPKGHRRLAEAEQYLKGFRQLMSRLVGLQPPATRKHRAQANLHKTMFYAGGSTVRIAAVPQQHHLERP